MVAVLVTGFPAAAVVVNVAVCGLGGEALAAISVDGAVSSDVRRRLLELPDVLTATIVRFDDETAPA